MSTIEVADKLIQLWTENRNEEAIKELYPKAEDITRKSFLICRQKQGNPEMLKNSQFLLMPVDEVHSMSVTEPLIMGEYFCFSLTMDFTIKDLGRSSIRESWVFEVDKGKIVYERFFHYGGNIAD